MNIDIQVDKVNPETLQDMPVLTFFVADRRLYYKANDDATLNVVCFAGDGLYRTTAQFAMAAFRVIPHEKISIVVKP